MPLIVRLDPGVVLDRVVPARFWNHRRMNAGAVSHHDGRSPSPARWRTWPSLFPLRACTGL